MSDLIKLFQLLYPFIHEFGIKEVNIKAFIAQNKTLSYLMMICILLFVMLLYALEQAHLRMLYRVVLVDEKTALVQELQSSKTRIDQLEILCAENDSITGGNHQSIEESLNELTGTKP